MNLLFSPILANIYGSHGGAQATATQPYSGYHYG
jgi:hypothetical protein